MSVQTPPALSPTSREGETRRHQENSQETLMKESKQFSH